MKLWNKTIICLMLVFIIALSPITTGILQIRKAEASFVPFIVENAEWLLAILAAFGISFATQNDALAGVHDFAYSLDKTMYDDLQNYIEQQKNIFEFKIATTGIIGTTLWNAITGYAEEIYNYFETAPERYIDYVIAEAISGDFISRGYTLEDDYYDITKANLTLPTKYKLTFQNVESAPIKAVELYTTQGSLRTIRYINNKIEMQSSGAVYTLADNLQTGDVRYLDVFLVGTTYYVGIDDISFSAVAGSLFKGLRVYNDLGILIPDTYVEQNISATIEKDTGISMNDIVWNLPAPLPGISHPMRDKVINVPQSIEEGIALSPWDVLQQPAIDNFGNPVLDGVGNPVYEPVPQTWPNTQNPAYPPWPLSPDIEGVAEGTGVIGGILENIRDWVGDIGTFLTIDLPRILTTDIPIAIENIFNNPPPGDNENDVSDKMKDFKLPDLIFLFFGVILACIRLMIRFITFLTSLLLRPADGSIIPAGMKESLNFLKNWSIGLPVSFYTLFSSLMAFLFGLRMIKYIKIFVANVHGGITQSYDPREFNDNEVYNEWSRSGYKTEYSDYKKVYDSWKDSNSNLPWKGYLKREARGRKW